MTKFYVDGNDDFVLYQIISDLKEDRPGTGYVTDPNMLGVAIFRFIQEESKARTQASREWDMVSNLDIAIKETTYDTIVEIKNAGSTKVLERFIMRKILIPNSVFERYNTSISIPYSPSIPTITPIPSVTPVTPGSPIWTGGTTAITADTVQDSSTTVTISNTSASDKTDVVVNPEGQVTGTISLANGAAEEPRVNKVEPYFNVITAFDTIVRVPQSRETEYNKAIEEAMSVYDGIDSRIVKDHSVLTDDQIDSIKKELGDNATYPISVFSLSDMNVHMISGGGMSATVF